MKNNNDYKIEYGTEEWYLYHAWENEKPIIPLILATCFLVICNGGGLVITIMWIYYFLWSSGNNRKLDNDPEVQEKRRIYKEVRNKYF